jgi:dTDP-glucose 4,6-dehydratase
MRAATKDDHIATGVICVECNFHSYGDVYNSNEKINYGECPELNKMKKEKKTILLTGVLGFIGSNFVRQVVAKYPEYKFVGVDNSVREYSLSHMFSHPNYTFYLADIADKHIMNNIFLIEKPNFVINLAAESFVDHSIDNINPFIHSNILGVQVVVDMCLKHNVERLIHISTDEVLGQKLSINEEPWTEDAPLLARNPYACTKASSELIIRAAHYTHGLQFNMTRSCNVFGPRQKKENLIPMIFNSLINNKPITIHGTGKNFRQYVYVDDKINAVMQILKNGKVNEIYNIGDNNYLTNLEMVNVISKVVNKDPIIKK